MFERNVTDLVRGLRANKKNEQAFINQCLQEIREEIRSNDPQKKTNAVQKLTYLQMLGYDISWAAFQIIEVMTQTKFYAKRLGYLAASQSFNESTEVITLITHLLRKDMVSNNVYEAGMALNCLANSATPDLARDLAADVVSLLSSSRPYVRKKACLALYKIFLKFPDALRPAFPRLKEKLEDADPSVISASVNVICELARRNAKNYISLAPLLFTLMTNSTNNWMLIKIVKLFGALLPIEQRLAKKLVAPLTNLINNTGAKSLLYECISTCTVGLVDHIPTMKLCITKLRTFIEDPDQNLKYLGLLALNNIMKVHPKAVGEHRDLVIQCLDDDDVTIRFRALDLLEGMVSKRNIADIVKKLMDHLEKGDSMEYKDAIIEKIIAICSKNFYQNVTDFEWYISVLVELAHTPGTKHSVAIANQILDVTIRVKVVRDKAVTYMASLLRDNLLLNEQTGEGSNCEVLYAAAWIVGEFCYYLEDLVVAVESLLQPRVVSLPGHIQAAYIQAVMKIFSRVINGNDNFPEVEGAPEPLEIDDPTAVRSEILNVLQQRLPMFTQSQHLEVQERSCFLNEMVNIYKDAAGSTSLGVELDAENSPQVSIALEIAMLFADVLNPVAPVAQQRVKKPDDLDLDSWINSPPKEDSLDKSLYSFDHRQYKFEGSDSEKDDDSSIVSSHSADSLDMPSPMQVSALGIALAKPKKSADEYQKEAAKQREANKMWYLGSGSKSPTLSPVHSASLSSDDGGIAPLSDLGIKVSTFKDRIKQPKKPSRKAQAQVSITKEEELPEGATNEKETKKNEDDIFANINLTAPLRPDEVLPTPQHRVTAQPKKTAAPMEKKEKKEKRKKRSSRKDKTEASQTSTGSLLDLEAPTTAPSAESSGYELLESGIHEQPSEPASKPKKKKSSSKKESSKRKSKGAAPAPVKQSSSGSLSGSGSAQPSSPGPVRPTGQFKPLCQDEVLGVIYEPRVNPKEAKKILISFAFKNLNASEEVSGIEFSIGTTMNIGVAAESNPKAAFTLKPGETNTHNIILTVQSFLQAPKVTGNFKYLAGEEQRIKDFAFVLPCSSFVFPVKLTKEQFTNVLSESGPFSLASGDYKPTTDFKQFVLALSMLLHVDLVVVDTAAALYGKSIQGHHVAVLCKTTANGVHVDLKSNESALANSLINELGQSFPKA